MLSYVLWLTNVPTLRHAMGPLWLPEPGQAQGVPGKGRPAGYGDVRAKLVEAQASGRGW